MLREIRDALISLFGSKRIEVPAEILQTPAPNNVGNYGGRLETTSTLVNYINRETEIQGSLISYNGPSYTLVDMGDSPVWFSSSSNDISINEEVDPKPLSVFAKRIFPFIVSIDSIESNKRHSYLVPQFGGLFNVNVKLTPDHFSEVFSNDETKNMLISEMKKELSPLIRCLYGNVTHNDIVFTFHPEETKDLYNLLKAKEKSSTLYNIIKE